MALAPDFPIPIMVLGAAKGGTALFRQGGKLHLTCVLKSTFQLVPGAPMKQVSTQQLFRKEVNRYDNPCLSIIASNEIVPYLPRVDVVMTGHARAPEGRSVPRLNVRLALYHGIALLDKTVHVYGDHNGKEFVPFEQMPLEYERSVGGPGHLENPYGTGNLPGSKLPNLMNPQDPGSVAGFGPIAQRLPVRSSKLGKLTPSALSQTIPEFPDDFDWSYFQAAPTDQQLPSIMGNEWIVLEGIHPEMTRLSSRLPSVRAIATIFGTNPNDLEATQSLQLRIDMIRIDADALRCCVVARGVVQIADEQNLSTIRVAGAMETEDLSYASVLVPPTASAKSTMRVEAPAATLRMEENVRTMPLIKMAESLDQPTQRRANQGALVTPTGTLALDAAPPPAPVLAPAIDVNRSLAATLDTYHVDLSVPSMRLPAPPEPEWLDESDLVEVYSVDPRSNPVSLRGSMLQDKPD